MLRGLQVKKRQKISLAVIFGLVLLIIFFEFLRMEESLKGTGHSNNALWVELEEGVAIVVSCLPTYNALLHRPRDARTLTVDSYARFASSMNLRATTGTSSRKNGSNFHHDREEIPLSVITSNQGIAHAEQSATSQV